MSARAGEQRTHARRQGDRLRWRRSRKRSSSRSNPPAISGLGVASGFTLKLQDRGGNGAEALLDARNQLLAAASQSTVLAGVRPEGQEDAPQLARD